MRINVDFTRCVEVLSAALTFGWYGKLSGSFSDRASSNTYGAAVKTDEARGGRDIEATSKSVRNCQRQKTKRLVEAVKTNLGITPTMTRVLAKKERVAGNDFEGVRKAGIGDGQIEEIITIAPREVEDA